MGECRIAVGSDGEGRANGHQRPRRRLFHQTGQRNTRLHALAGFPRAGCWLAVNMEHGPRETSVAERIAHRTLSGLGPVGDAGAGPPASASPWPSCSCVHSIWKGHAVDGGRVFESTSIAHSTGRPESEAVETRPIAPPVHPLAERERERERRRDRERKGSRD